MRKQQHGQPGPESQGASPLFDPLIPLTKPNLSVGSNTAREQQDTAGCAVSRRRIFCWGSSLAARPALFRQLLGAAWLPGQCRGWAVHGC